MATAMLCRRALAQRALPLAIGVSLGIGQHTFASRHQPLRLDAPRSAPPAFSTAHGRQETDIEDEFLDSDVIRQLSGGSVSGKVPSISCASSMPGCSVIAVC
jgi:hypothetical protein